MRSPEELRPHYSDFIADDRILLSGHSHQAWPNVARQGVLRAYEDASIHIDDKWSRALAVADELRASIANDMGGDLSLYALGQNTSELVHRFLSALDFEKRPKIVASDGEFHSMRRLLMRLAESGVDVVFVPANGIDSLAARMAAEVDERTAAVMVSTVHFQSSSWVPHIDQLVEKAQHVGAEVLLDAYHHFRAREFEWKDLDVFCVGGGYKYAQWGEGVCFMRVPQDCQLRPHYTGWFADFSSLDQQQEGIRYGQRPADRFTGSTYDPSAHYRALAVRDFWQEMGIGAAGLQARYRQQTTRIVENMSGVELISPSEGEKRAGFVAMHIENAAEIVQALRKEKIWCDSRGPILRFGPAPYLRDEDIDKGCEALRRHLSL